MRASRRYAGRLKKSPRQATFDAMCLVVELHQKAEDSGGFDLDASPDSEELDLQFTEDAPSKVVTALLCLGGDTGFSQSRQFASEVAVRAAGSWRCVAHHPCSSGMHVRHHVPRSGGGFVSCAL